MTAEEKWNMMVRYHSGNRKPAKWRMQNFWEATLPLILDYSPSRGDVDVKPNLTVARKIIIPSIIIKAGGKGLFVVEIKRHNKPLDKGRQAQMLDCLKASQISTGVLICSKLYLFAYDYTKSDDELNVAEIEFRQSNPDGIRFVEMFSRNTFDEADIKAFVSKRHEFKRNIEQIKTELNADLAITLFRDHFTKNYGSAEFDQAIEELNIEITPRQKTKEKPVSTRKLTHILSKPAHRQGSLSKSGALDLCNKNGIPIIDGQDTYASVSSDLKLFSANPNINRLKNDWVILLNDHSKKKLHVFRVPANEISENEVKRHADKQRHLMDLRISNMDDGLFETIPSGLRFEKWFVKTIDY